MAKLLLLDGYHRALAAVSGNGEAMVTHSPNTWAHPALWCRRSPVGCVGIQVSFNRPTKLFGTHLHQVWRTGKHYNSERALRAKPGNARKDGK